MGVWSRGKSLTDAECAGAGPYIASRLPAHTPVTPGPGAGHPGLQGPGWLLHLSRARAAAGGQLEKCSPDFMTDVEAENML